MASEIAQRNFTDALQTREFQGKMLESLIDQKKVKRFSQNIALYVSNTPTLAECEPMSILTTALHGESLGLSPSVQLGQYYMIPRKDKKTGTTKATFLLGYKGLIQLALRTGQYRTINCIGIKRGELRYWNPLTEEIELDFIQNWAQREAAESVGYVAYIEYKNGYRKTVFWTRQQVEAHRNRYNPVIKPGSVWNTNFDAMAQKTVLAAALRQCEMTADTQLAQAMELDMEDSYPPMEEAPTVQAQPGPQTSGPVIDATFQELQNDEDDDVF